MRTGAFAWALLFKKPSAAWVSAESEQNCPVSNFHSRRFLLVLVRLTGTVAD